MNAAYQVQVHECDKEIEEVLRELNVGKPKPTEPLPKPRHRTREPNQLNFDVQQSLYGLIGSNITQIHGLGPYLSLRLVSKRGLDMSK